MTEKEVLKFVRERLKTQPLEGITIEVMDEGIERQGQYLYIPVQPSIQPEHTFAYYDVLAEIETDLSMDHNVNILLVPTLPESYLAEQEALDRELQAAKMKVSAT